MPARAWPRTVLAGVGEGDSFFATKAEEAAVLEVSGVTATSDFLWLCSFA